MKESELIIMKRKIEQLGALMQGVLQELTNLRDLSVGTLETMKKMPGYEKAIKAFEKDKDKIFNTPAFNYDEVVTLPKNAILLSSNKVNNVMALNFETEFSKIWGIQYHPEITYKKMITLIKFRRERLLENKSFSDEKDLESHISMIENEDKITKKESRMRELKNWLDLIA